MAEHLSEHQEFLNTGADAAHRLRQAIFAAGSESHDTPPETTLPVRDGTFLFRGSQDTVTTPGGEGISSTLHATGTLVEQQQPALLIFPTDSEDFARDHQVQPLPQQP